ncbi:hypothetical protein [Oceanobacillus sp. CAU 1775]
MKRNSLYPGQMRHPHLRSTTRQKEYIFHRRLQPLPLIDDHLWLQSLPFFSQRPG